MAYFSPFYAPHFDLSASSQSPHDPNAFVIPERLYHHHRAIADNLWSALSDHHPAPTPEQRTEEAYRSFQSDCYSAAPGTPTSKQPTADKGADWWSPRLQRKRGQGSQVALALGWLCLVLFADIAFAACWVVGHQIAQGWVYGHLASAGHWALEIWRKVFRKIWSIARCEARRTSAISKAATSWLLGFFEIVARRALSLAMEAMRQGFDLSGAALSWMRNLGLRAYWALPRCEASPFWLLSTCAALMLLLKLQEQPPRDIEPVYVLISRFQSRGSGPWPTTDRL